MRIRSTIIYLAILAACLLCTTTVRGQETFKRKLEQVSFVPKGAWITGVSVNYSQSGPGQISILDREPAATLIRSR